MKNVSALWGLAALGLALSACAPGSGTVEVGESTEERGDALGKLRGSCVDSCNEKTSSKGGNCWCDASCVEHGDCCADYEDVCGEPEKLCLGDNHCGAAEYCDHSECFNNCPEGMVCPAVCWGQCLAEPVGEACGSNVCGAGTYCCNASCGTCAPFDASCTQQVCEPTE